VHRGKKKLRGSGASLEKNLHKEAIPIAHRALAMVAAMQQWITYEKIESLKGCGGKALVQSTFEWVASADLLDPCDPYGQVIGYRFINGKFTRTPGRISVWGVSYGCQVALSGGGEV
jgi:hypothetical protein